MTLFYFCLLAFAIVFVLCVIWERGDEKIEREFQVRTFLKSYRGKP